MKQIQLTSIERFASKTEGIDYTVVANNPSRLEVKVSIKGSNKHITVVKRGEVNSNKLIVSYYVNNLFHRTLTHVTTQKRTIEFIEHLLSEVKQPIEQYINDNQLEVATYSDELATITRITLDSVVVQIKQYANDKKYWVALNHTSGIVIVPFNEYKTQQDVINYLESYEVKALVNQPIIEIKLSHSTIIGSVVREDSNQWILANVTIQGIKEERHEDSYSVPKNMAWSHKFL